MKSKLLLCLALVLSGGLVGCSTTARRSSATVPRDVGFPYEKMNGFAYETKPLSLGSRGLFYCFVSDDLKSIYYEPCIGHYAIESLKTSKSELVFKISGSYGIPIDLRNGEEIVASDVVGKKYLAKLEGDHIVSVSETKP